MDVESSQPSVGRVTLNFNNAAADANFNLGAMSRYRPELRDVVLPETVRIHTGVPGGSTVAGNLTVQGSCYDGHARAYPCNESAPTASVSNFLAGGTVSNFVVIKTDPNGDICVDSPAPAHFVFDVVGSAGQAAASAPRRLLDTRAAAMPPAGTTVRVHTQAAPGSLALGNVTVTQARGSGHVDLSCGQPVPTTSVNNYRAGQTVPNFAATQTDSHGDICIFTSGPTHLLYDYLGSSRADVTEAPARLIDTRNGARPKARAVVRVHTAMSPGSTVAGNPDGDWGGRHGPTRVWNCDESMPDTSVNNYRRGETRPNFIAVTTDNKGDFCVMNTASADIFFDSSGSSSVCRRYPRPRGGHPQLADWPAQRRALRTQVRAAGRYVVRDTAAQRCLALPSEGGTAGPPGQTERPLTRAPLGARHRISALDRIPSNGVHSTSFPRPVRWKRGPRRDFGGSETRNGWGLSAGDNLGQRRDGPGLPSLRPQ